MGTNEVLESFSQALTRLDEVLAKPFSLLTRDAAIKRFEFTFELAWKATQKTLRAEGILCRSPKACFQEAFALQLIQDNPLWIRMLEDRNLTVHTYNDATAQRIYDHLLDYQRLFQELLDNLTRYQQHT